MISEFFRKKIKKKNYKKIWNLFWKFVPLLSLKV